MEIIGLIPAAGTASRISPIPCSKEIFPVGFAMTSDGKRIRPKGGCHYLLEKMQVAGAEKAYIVIRDGKWDIPAYLGDGSSLRLNLAYLMMNAPYGVPFTLDQAYSFVGNATILFGFPDILFLPENAYSLMLERLWETSADVVLGLFRTDHPERTDTVHLAADEGIVSIDIKNAGSKASHCWIIAVWKPSFTRFLHDHVGYVLGTESMRQPAEAPTVNKEIHLGTVISCAMEAGLRINPFIFKDGRFLDIGTPETLSKATDFWL
jgi:glucose-1-phosphate thymidylyltransferase